MSLPELLLVSAADTIGRQDKWKIQRSQIVSRAFQFNDDGLSKRSGIARISAAQGITGAPEASPIGIDRDGASNFDIALRKGSRHLPAVAGEVTVAIVGFHGYEAQVGEVARSRRVSNRAPGHIAHVVAFQAGLGKGHAAGFGEPFGGLHENPYRYDYSCYQTHS